MRQTVAGTAAAATAIGMLGRTFAAAEVEPSLDRTGLNPAIMAQIGSGFISAGESVWLIRVGDDGVVSLDRAASWNVLGTGPDWRDWHYQLNLPGPTAQRTLTAPAATVLHPRINASAMTPHQGRSPLVLSGFTSRALANAERQLAEELSGPVGRLIPAPLDALSAKREDGTTPLAELEAALAALKGRSALVPSLQRDSLSGASQGQDWQSRRIGADPPDSVVNLRKDGHDAILSACGIPPGLYATAGTQARESLRQFLHVTVTPYAKILETECRAKLGGEITFDFTGLHASDVQGRARAFKSMVDGGMALVDAAAASGILLNDD